MTSIVIDGLAIGSAYCLFGWAFAYDSLSRGYVNLAMGDAGILLFACIWSVFTFEDQLSVGAWVLIAVGCGLAYAAFRSLAHQFVFFRFQGRDGLQVLLCGLGIAIASSAILELVVSGALWHGLDPRSILRTRNVLGYSLVPRSIFFFFSAGFGVIVLLASRRTRLGAATDLVRENRSLCKDLNLPLKRIDAHNQWIASALVGAAVVTYLCRFPIEPTSGLKLTILGFVISTTALRRPIPIAVVGLSLGLAERFIGAGYLPVESYWAPYISISIVFAIGMLNPEIWRFVISEDASHVR